MSSGYFGPRNQFRIARKAVLKANQNRKKSYKLQLRDNKKSRIIMLNAALSKYNIKYNVFMRYNNLTMKLTTKVLVDIIMSDNTAFQNIVEYIIHQRI